MRAELNRFGDSRFAFREFPPMSVKGYDLPVSIYMPLVVERSGKLRERVSSRDIAELMKGRRDGSPTGAPRKGSAKDLTSTGYGNLSESVLMRLDKCSFREQMIVKLCSTIVASHSGTASSFSTATRVTRMPIQRSVLIALYPGPFAEVDDALSSLVKLQFLERVDVSKLDVVLEFTRKFDAGAIYDLMLSEQRTRYHQQLADWYRRRCLVRMEEADVKPNDIVTHLDTISDQLARCGDAIGSATLMCAAAKLYGEVHMPRHVRNDGVFIGTSPAALRKSKRLDDGAERSSARRLDHEALLSLNASTEQLEGAAAAKPLKRARSRPPPPPPPCQPRPPGSNRQRRGRRFGCVSTRVRVLSVPAARCPARAAAVRAAV